MAPTQFPSPREFLVSVPEGALEEALAQPEGLGRGKRLDERSLVVELPGQSDPRAAWRQLVDRFRSAAWVSPVVVDDGRNLHYPTGDITVRFRRAVSDKRLQQFADSNGLELRSRNEFITEQASFGPRDPRGTYLPDLVEQLQHEDAVGAAWLNTKTFYKRA